MRPRAQVCCGSCRALGPPLSSQPREPKDDPSSELLKGLVRRAGGGTGGPSGRQWGAQRGTPRPTFILLSLLLLAAGVRAQELGEGAVPGQQLLVGAHLRDLAAGHDNDDIHLGQVADAVRDQEPCLRAEREPAGVSTWARQASPNTSPAQLESECLGRPDLWMPSFNPCLPGGGGQWGGKRAPGLALHGQGEKGWRDV